MVSLVAVAVIVCLGLLIVRLVRVRARLLEHLKLPGLPRIAWVFAIGFALVFSLPPTDVSGQQVLTTSQPQDQTFSAPFLNGTNGANMPQLGGGINPGGGGTVTAFATATRGWISTLSGMATRIFFLLAVIDFAWMVIQWLMTGRENTGEFLGQWVVKLFGISVIYWLVLIHGWELSQIIIGSILTAGENISGVGGGHVVSNSNTFEGIVATGTALATPMFIEALVAGAIPDIAGVGFTNLALPLMYTELFGATAVLAAYILMAGSLLLVWIEMYICTTLGLLMLGFSGSRWTSGFGWEKYLMMSFSIGIKMLMTYICVDLAMNIGTALIGTTMVPGIGAIYGGFIASIMTLIVYNVPAFASSLLQGASSSAAGGALSFSSGVASQMAGAMQTMTQSMEAFAATIRARDEELRDEKMAALPAGSAPAPGFGSDGNMSVFTGQPVTTELAADSVEGKTLEYAALGQGNQAGAPTGANEALDKMFFGSGGNGEQGGRGVDGIDGVNAYAGLTNGMPSDQSSDGSRFVDMGNGQGVMLAQNGTAVTPDGAIVGTNGAVRELDGTVVTSNGDVLLPDGRVVLGDDRVFDRNGRELAALDSADRQDVDIARQAALNDRTIAEDARSSNVPADDSSLVAATLTNEQQAVVEQLERMRETEQFGQRTAFAEAVREELLVERRINAEQPGLLMRPYETAIPTSAADSVLAGAGIANGSSAIDSGSMAGRPLEFASPSQSRETMGVSSAGDAFANDTLRSSPDYGERPAAFETSLAGAGAANGSLSATDTGVSGRPLEFADRPAAFASPTYEGGIAAGSMDTALAGTSGANGASMTSDAGAAGRTLEFASSSQEPQAMAAAASFAAGDAVVNEAIRPSSEFADRSAAFASPTYDGDMAAGSMDTALAGPAGVNGTPMASTADAGGRTLEFAASSQEPQEMASSASFVAGDARMNEAMGSSSEFADRPAAFASPTYEGGIAAGSMDTALANHAGVNGPSITGDVGTGGGTPEFVSSLQEPQASVAPASFALGDAMPNPAMRSSSESADSAAAFVSPSSGDLASPERAQQFASRSEESEPMTSFTSSNQTSANPSLANSEAMGYEPPRSERATPGDYVERPRGDQNDVLAMNAAPPSVQAFEATAPQRDALNAPSTASLSAAEMSGFEPGRGERATFAEYAGREQGDTNDVGGTNPSVSASPSREAESRLDSVSAMQPDSSIALSSNASGRPGDFGAPEQEAVSAPSSASLPSSDTIAYEPAGGERNGSAEYIDRPRAEQNIANRTDTFASGLQSSDQGRFAGIESPSPSRSFDSASRQQDVVMPPSTAALSPSEPIATDSTVRERAPSQTVEPRRAEPYEETPAKTHESIDSYESPISSGPGIRSQQMTPTAAESSSLPSASGSTPISGRGTATSSETMPVTRDSSDADISLSQEDGLRNPRAATLEPATNDPQASSGPQRSQTPQDALTRPNESAQSGFSGTNGASNDRVEEVPKESLLSRLFGFGRPSAETSVRELRERTVEERTIRETRTRDDASQNDGTARSENDAAPSDVYDPSATPPERRTIFDSEPSVNTRDNGKKG